MVPNIEYHYILLLGHSILYKESYLARFNHQKKRSSHVLSAKPLEERYLADYVGFRV